jgi:hypothetical protein
MPPDQITGTPHQKKEIKPLRAITPAIFTSRLPEPILHPRVSPCRAGSLHPTWSHRQSSPDVVALAVFTRRGRAGNLHPTWSRRQSSPDVVASAVFTRRVPASILHPQVTPGLVPAVFSVSLSVLQGRDYPIRPRETRYVSSL